MEQQCEYMLACGRSPRIIVSAAIVFKVVLSWFRLGLLCSLPGERHAWSHFDHEQPEQIVQRMKEAQSEALKLQHVLKSHFPAGVHDSQWTGTADEVRKSTKSFWKRGLWWLQELPRMRKGKLC